jgi:hypothetical protein
VELDQLKKNPMPDDEKEVKENLTFLTANNDGLIDTMGNIPSDLSFLPTSFDWRPKGAINAVF